MIIIQLDSEQLSNLIQKAEFARFWKKPHHKRLNPPTNPEQLLTIQQAADF